MFNGAILPSLVRLLSFCFASLGDVPQSLIDLLSESMSRLIDRLFTAPLLVAKVLVAGVGHMGRSTLV